MQNQSTPSHPSLIIRQTYIFPFLIGIQLRANLGVYGRLYSKWALQYLIGMENSAALEPPKRNKELTDKELKNIRMNIQKLSLSPQEDIFYSLVTKDSKSGFFSNDRILVLSSRDKELSYLSKIPEGLIPFLSEAEVKSLKHKAKVSREAIKSNQVTQFKCAPLPGKFSTFQVEFKKGSEEEKWQFVAGNSKSMNEWVELINKTLVLEEPPKPPEQPKPVEQNIQISETLPKVPSQRVYRPLNEGNPLQSDNLSGMPAAAGEAPRVDGNALNQPSAQESQIAKMPYSDHASELKYLRQQNPKMFVTDNELSKKKLPPIEEAELENNRNSMNTRNPATKQPLEESGGHEVNSRLIDDSRADSQDSNSRFQPLPRQLFTDANSFKKSKSGVSRQNEPHEPYEERLEDYPSRNPSRRNMDQYSRARQEEMVEPQIKVNTVESSRGPGIIASRSRSNQNFANEMPQRSSQEYEPVNSVKMKGEDNRSSHQSSQKNIVIKDIDSNEDVRLVRDSGKASQRSNNFVSKGSNYMSNNTLKSNFNSKQNLARRKWNEIFAETPNKLDIYEDFVQTSYNVVREIINELPLDKNQKQFLPIEVKSPYFTYFDDGIIITLHYFENGKNVPTVGISSDAPLLYDQSTYELLKREFYNYNLILNVTSNEGFIKVPLCAYFEYKGIVAVCKAEIPENFSEITPKRYEKQFDIIENQIHVRFMYGSFNSYLHPNSKYIILDNMRELIPEIPLQNKDQQFFRKQFLLGYGQIIEDMESCNEAHYSITHQILPDLVTRLETLETYVVCSADLQRTLHESGLSLAYLPHLIHQTRAPYAKKIFVTELAATVFTSIFRSEINHLTATFPLEQFQEISLEIINRILLDSCHTLIELMFGYSNTAESIWKIIVEQCNLKYKVAVSKEDLIPGYLFGSIIERFGLICDFRRSTFNKHNVQFFVKSGNIPKDLFTGFKMRTRRFDLAPISPVVRDIEIILGAEPNSDNFKAIVNTLRLKEQSIPNFLQNLEPPLLTYLCNFIPYSEHEEFQHIGIYNMVVLEPHSYYSVKLSLLAIKWCIKKKLSDEAFKIFEMKEIENAFWLGEYNPAISEFYDFFSMYNASMGKYEEAIQLAKLSLKNTTKVLGVNELPVADKHYQLGNIYFKMGRKDESLKEYTKTKEILTAHNQVHISEYAVILLKLGVLYLNFGKISECVSSSLEALKIFDETQKSELDEIGTFQILSRCYQITKKNNELLKIGEIVAQKFNQTENPQIFERMIKIVLYTRLKNLSSVEAKAFIFIVSKLQEQSPSIDYTETFTFLHRKCQSEILMKKITNFLDNIVSLYEEASKRDLYRRYKSLDVNTRNEAEQMLVLFDAIGNMIGYGYLIGSLKENQ